MRRLLTTLAVLAAFIVPAAISTAPAAAATNYPCTGNAYTDYNCAYANTYACWGSTWWVYRFWQHIYNLNTGQVVSSYKESLVDRSNGGKVWQSFYVSGWAYSPC